MDKAEELAQLVVAMTNKNTPRWSKDQLEVLARKMALKITREKDAD